jgi:hypothetical protein
VISNDEWIDAAWDWARSHPSWLLWATAVSVLMAVSTPALVGWVVIQLPTDYFLHQRQIVADAWHRHPVLRPIVFLVKNVLGIVLFASGIVMLVAPGQGVLTIVVGVMLVDFPGKRSFERWLATRPPVWRSINWLRERAGRAPLEDPN